MRFKNLIRFQSRKDASNIRSFDGVVVITSASHAEGREFEPRSEYFFIIWTTKANFGYY